MGEFVGKSAWINVGIDTKEVPYIEQFEVVEKELSFVIKDMLLESEGALLKKIVETGYADIIIKSGLNL